MATGISGDNAILAGQPSANLSAIELRVISELLQNLLGVSTAQDDLKRLRNDVAFELSVNPPTEPGN